jgi:hypothetical protein
MNPQTGVLRNIASGLAAIAIPPQNAASSEVRPPNFLRKTGMNGFTKKKPTIVRN